MFNSTKRIIGVGPRGTGTFKEPARVNCSCADELGIAVFSVRAVQDLYPLICNPDQRIDMIVLDLDDIDHIFSGDIFAGVTALTNLLDTMPGRGEDGHAVTVIGYDLRRKQFLLKNSFGTHWGAGGYAWLPFEYEREYVFERWVFDINDQNTVI